MEEKTWSTHQTFNNYCRNVWIFTGKRMVEFFLRTFSSTVMVSFMALDCRFKLTLFPLLGVSESQYQAVLDLELKPIQVHCEKVYHSQKSAPPKITIIIVGKRHHTRFYPTNDAHADLKHGGKLKLCNPRNGTIVDRGITMHKGWDFYLQAHSAIKGTVSTVHYGHGKVP